MIACAVSLSAIDDAFGGADDDTDLADDRDRYNGAAGWLLFVAIAGIIIQIIMLIVRALYYGEVITSQFIVFGIVVSF